MWVRVAGITVSLLDFSIYFEIEKDYPIWTGPHHARPVPDCQSGAWSSPTLQWERTGPSPTPDRGRPDWWNHWISVGCSFSVCARDHTNGKLDTILEINVDS